MEYIAIYQTNKDIQTDDAVLKQLPDAYPILCEQGFKSQEDALAKYPNATVMTVDVYQGYKAAFDVVYAEASAGAQQSFWSKLNPFS